MMPQPFRQTCVSILILALGAGPALAQTSTSKSTTKSGSTGSQRTTSTRGGPAKGPLPDPELLDGSKQAADKRSEYGMIGDFELPGDENARTGKVGGPQNPNQQNGQQQGGGGAAGMPQAGGQAGQQGGSQGEQAQAGQQAANQQGGGGKPVDSADANAQAGGTQVSELSGDAQGQLPGGDNKPKQVAIGDAAMRIETQNVAGVVGTQQAGQTQQHEKGTGTGGKQAAGNNSNKGVERGRTMPSGL